MAWAVPQLAVLCFLHCLTLHPALRGSHQAGPHFSEHPEDWFTARDQALVLHLITEALRQPHPLGDALHRRARADAGTGKLCVPRAGCAPTAP